jgi:TonB family protein
MDVRRGWLLLAVGCAFFVLATSAQAQDSTRARLLTELDAATFDEHFPAIALAQGLDGRVVLSCDISADGASACSVIEDTPVNVGFGAAAIAMSRGWTFAPRLENGQAVASTLRMNIAFENEFSTRQALQTTLYVDERRDATEPGAEANALDVDYLSYLACTWAGRFCRAPDDGSAVQYQNTRHYPSAARASGVEGRALVACAARANNRIDCAVESEAPAGSEFGAHALRLVADTAAAFSLPQGTVFRVPVEFALHPSSRPERDSAWEELPSGADFARHYPPLAVQRGVDGAAMVLCEIQADRRVACELQGEAPENFGFGRAALRMASQYRVSEQRFGLPGYTVGERLRWTIVFHIE